MQMRAMRTKTEQISAHYSHRDSNANANNDNRTEQIFAHYSHRDSNADASNENKNRTNLHSFSHRDSNADASNEDKAEQISTHSLIEVLMQMRATRTK